jgi:hypothetical protein
VTAQDTPESPQDSTQHCKHEVAGSWLVSCVSGLDCVAPQLAHVHQCARLRCNNLRVVPSAMLCCAVPCPALALPCAGVPEGLA